MRIRSGMPEPKEAILEEIEDVGLEDTISAEWDRDMRTSARYLTESDARFLVDSYYTSQKHRIAFGNQVRASYYEAEGPKVINGKAATMRDILRSGLPNRFLIFLFNEALTLEHRIQLGLGEYVKNQPISRWLLPIHGIGTVLSAGLIANIDMDHTPSIGSLISFAGLSVQGKKWLGTKAATEIVSMAFRNEPTIAQAIYYIARGSGRRVCDLYNAMSPENIVSREQAMREIGARCRASDRMLREAFDERPLHIDNAILHACETFNVEPKEVYDALFMDKKVDKKALTAALAKRPHNTGLKTLLWKIGQSFVKSSGNENSFYGRFYRVRKEFEIARNLRGECAEAAERELSSKNYGKDTEAYKYYTGDYIGVDPETGKGIPASTPGSGIRMLPPAHIHARACRVTVKLFLSHFWEMWFRQRNPGKEVPMPYAMVYLPERHEYIPPPNQHCFDS